MEADAPLQLSPGQILARDYRVVRALAAGGMGSVYFVEQLSTGKERALKVMHPQFARDEASRVRFAQEARAGARIKSEHVVEVVAAGVDDATGIPWLAMELLDGEELSSRMRRAGHLPWGEVLEIFRQLGHGLGEAHRQGLVHRDLKPENIFIAVARSLSAPFTLKILDFGVAKLVQESQTQTDGTRPVGTPRWMAPEQSEEHAHITPATDVWAMGLLAFYLLTGRFYWRAANNGSGLTTLLRELVLDPIEPPSQRALALGVGKLLPPRFDEWFGRCVVRDAKARFPDADAAMRGLVPLFARMPVWDVNAIPVIGRAKEPERDIGDAATQATAGLEAKDARKTGLQDDGATLPPPTPDVPPRARSLQPAHASQATIERALAQQSDSHAPEPGGIRSGAELDSASRPQSFFARHGKVLVVILVLLAAAVAAFALRPRKPKPWPPDQSGAPSHASTTPTATPVAPEETPALPPPSFVFLLNTQPQGAEVFEGDSRLGITPLKLTLDNASLQDAPRQFRLVKPGYLPRKVSQGPGSGMVMINEELEEEPQPTTKPAPKKHREGSPAFEPQPQLRLQR